MRNSSTSDGLIAKYNLTVLDDPRQSIPPYDAILLLAPRRANDAALKQALQPLLGKIDVATMQEANLRAAGSASSDVVARCARGLFGCGGGRLA